MGLAVAKDDLNPEIAMSDLVLIVDDEEAIRLSLQSVLEDEGFATITTGDGESAVQLVLERKPSLVFLDIWMPGWDGIQTLEKIKQVSPETEVIMISGHATISNALEASKRGAFDFIEKPLNIEGVSIAARRALVHKLDKAGKISSLNESEVTAGVNAKIINHPGMMSKALAGKNRGQRTLKQSTILYGQCLHSGQKSGLVLEPLPLNSGIHFGKIGDARTVPAFVDFVQSTGFATTVRFGDVSAATIEHLMSALHAYGITNLLIKCNAEVPIFDGSAREFCSIIESVGIEEQGGEWYELVIPEKISFSAEDGNAKEEITIEPYHCFSLTYELAYPEPIGYQSFSFDMDNVAAFKEVIAPCRTFGFVKDIERLQKAGLAAGGRLDNFILIGSDKIVNTELRFEDELARHKILDAIGDLFLIGRPLIGKVHAKMTGHSDNIELLKKVALLLK